MDEAEGAVVDGLSETTQEIMLKNGRVVQSNYHQHSSVKISQTPPIEAQASLNFDVLKKSMALQLIKRAENQIRHDATW